MNQSIGEYHVLVNVLDNTKDASLSQKTQAAGQAFKLIDSQISTINQTTSISGFDGASAMDAAIQLMKSKAALWPNVELHTKNAAQAIVNMAPKVADLCNEYLDPNRVPADHIMYSDEQKLQFVKDELRLFVQGPLSQLKTDFANAQNEFSNFESQLESAYSQSETANAEAIRNITAKKLELDNSIKTLNAKIDAANSAGSIILDILTLGIKAVVDVTDINNQIDKVRDQESRLNALSSMYNAAMRGFTACLSSTKIASYALITINTSLQQSHDALSNMSDSQTNNLIVIKVQIDQFKSEFADAVRAAQNIIQP